MGRESCMYVQVCVAVCTCMFRLLTESTCEASEGLTGQRGSRMGGAHRFFFKMGAPINPHLNLSISISIPTSQSHRCPTLCGSIVSQSRTCSDRISVAERIPMFHTHITIIIIIIIVTQAPRRSARSLGRRSIPSCIRTAPK